MWKAAAGAAVLGALEAATPLWRAPATKRRTDCNKAIMQMGMSQQMGKQLGIEDELISAIIQWLYSMYIAKSS